MRFVAEREKIIEAVGFVAKYAAKDSKIPILAHVRLSARKGLVTVVATDAERAASDTFKADIEGDGEACLPAKLLLASIKSATASDVVISADDRQASIKVGKSQFKMPILPAGDFPAMPMLAEKGDRSFRLSAERLSQVRNEVAFAVEDKGGRYFLTGTSWRIVAGKLEFCATNGKKFSLLSTDAPQASVGMADIIVPEFDAPSWESGDVDVSVSPTFIRLVCNGQSVASKLIDGSFPDYRQLIPTNPTPLLFDRAELLASINRMALVADAREHSILFVGRDGHVTISAQTAAGEVTDELIYNGDDFQTAIAHSVASAILNSFDCETIEWRWADHATGITMHVPDNGERLAFAMPYRDQRLIQYAHPLAEAAE